MLPSKLEGITPLHGTETDHTAVWQFEQSLKTAWGVYPHLSDETKCIFIRQNLGAIPRDEIQFYSDTNDSEELFKILHKAFGDHRSWGQMLQHFIGISQLSNESIQVFSHRVMKAWQAILRAQSQRCSQVVTDTLLVDVFVNGLSDCFLKKVLKEDLFLSPGTTIYKLREKALRWESAALMVKDHSTGDSEVSLQPEEIDSSIDQFEVTLLSLCSKLDAFVSNISAQTSFQPTKRKRRRKRRRHCKKAETNAMSTDYLPSLPHDISEKPPIAPNVSVAHSMSAYMVSQLANNSTINKPSDMNSDVVQPHMNDDLILHTDCVSEKKKETILVKNSEVWALHGEKGQTMTFLKERSGCEINVLKAAGDRSKGLRSVELEGTQPSIEKVKMLIQEECGITVF